MKNLELISFANADELVCADANVWLDEIEPASFVAAGILACRRAGASSPAAKTFAFPKRLKFCDHPNFPPFFPGGKMPRSTSGKGA